jgi:hypothetical protein
MFFRINRANKNFQARGDEYNEYNEGSKKEKGEENDFSFSSPSSDINPATTYLLTHLRTQYYRLDRA